MKTPTIAIIGSGSVGSTLAYTLVQRALGNIVLIDKDTACCAAQVQDIEDAMHTFPAISKGTIAHAGQTDIAVIAAGARQQQGQSREDLLATNQEIVRTIIQQMQPLNPALIIIVVTNPVDLLTTTIVHTSKLPHGQIIGTGTLLDTLRLRIAVSKEIGVAAESVELYSIGAHNEHQVTLWSQGSIGGKSLAEFPQLTTAKREQITHQVNRKAYDIINVKGYTSFGIAWATTKIIEAIITDSKAVLPVSTYQEKYECSCSLPSVIGNQGVERIMPLDLAAQEEESFLTSLAQLQHIA